MIIDLFRVKTKKVSTYSGLDKSRHWGAGVLNTQSTFVTAISLLGLLSIWLAKYYPLDYKISLPWTAAGLLTTGLMLLLSRKPIIARVTLLFFVLLVLFVNSSNFKNSLGVYDDLYGDKVAFFGTVQDDAAYNSYSDYEFNLHRLNFAESGEVLPGRIRVKTKSPINVYRGDRLFVEGKLLNTLGSRMGSISYAYIEVVVSEPSPLENARLGFFSNVYSSIPEPHASLGIGFLAGVRSSITKEFQEDLSRVGLTHIIAVSGYNLTILVLAISKLGKRLSKYQRLIISLWLIGGFLLVTGFAPSIVRAAVVSILALMSAFFGRRISAVNLILISAVVTAGVNPNYLWSDIGWWLSFLAFAGVLILAPALSGIFYRDKVDDTGKVTKDRKPGLVGGIVLESFSAQVVTAPLIAHVFGTFSAVSLLANVLVLPWIPLIMLLVFVLGLIGYVSASAALIFGLLPKIIMTPIVWVIEKLSDLPWASAQLKLSLFGMLGCYLFLAAFVKISSRRNAMVKSV